VTPHLFPAFARSLRERLSATAWMNREPYISGLRCRRARCAAASLPPMGRWVRSFTLTLTGSSQATALGWSVCGRASGKPGIQLDRGWLGRRPRWRAGRRPAQYLRRGILWSNPQCGVYYLAALRACEEMASAMGEDKAAREYHQLFQQGSNWMDANLFNGEYYVQKVRASRKNRSRQCFAAKWVPRTPNARLSGR